MTVLPANPSIRKIRKVLQKEGHCSVITDPEFRRIQGHTPIKDFIGLSKIVGLEAIRNYVRIKGLFQDNDSKAPQAFEKRIDEKYHLSFLCGCISYTYFRMGEELDGNTYSIMSELHQKEGEELEDIAVSEGILSKEFCREIYGKLWDRFNKKYFPKEAS
jgi:hypothetical protein